ncbi:MAG: hypothetical protein J6M05_02885 [Cardiobacteriaceae bacterium]|nr:hypothetical protein [Cardiobacteriaceae bacterium]
MKNCNTVKSVAFLFFLLFFSACSSPKYSPEDLPQIAPKRVIWLKLEKINRENTAISTEILSVQGLENNETRWLLTDAFGAVKARVIATNDGWKNDGFAPPNREARRLFQAIFSEVDKPVLAEKIIELGSDKWRIAPMSE